MCNVRRLALALLCALVATTGVVRAECSAQRGARVELFGTIDDPDVLLWDSRKALLAYSGSRMRVVSAASAHALLNAPGTVARVRACVPDAVLYRYGSGNSDAVRILILSGLYRGRRGWVSSSDLRW